MRQARIRNTAPGDQLEHADSWLVRAAGELAEIGIGQAGELGQLAEQEFRKFAGCG